MGKERAQVSGETGGGIDTNESKSVLNHKLKATLQLEWPLGGRKVYLMKTNSQDKMEWCACVHVHITVCGGHGCTHVCVQTPQHTETPGHVHTMYIYMLCCMCMTCNTHTPGHCS